MIAAQSEHNAERIAGIIREMRPWWKEYREPRRRRQAPRHRHWDLGVLASAELVRRITGDEALALAVHGLLSDHLPAAEREGAKRGV